MPFSCIEDVMDVVFSVCIVRRGASSSCCRVATPIRSIV